VPFASLRDAGPAPPITDVRADELQRLMYTSGTTARPKGVMISYANLYWKNIAHVVEFGFTGADRGLACGPLYHVGALDLTTTTLLYVGGSIEILRKFDAEQVLDALERGGISTVWLAPSMVNQLMAHPTLERRDLSGVRVIIDGGEKMPLPLIQRLVGAFPNAWFADAYGLTETSGMTRASRFRRTRWARSSCVAPRCSQATGEIPRQRPPPSAGAGSIPVISAGWMPTARCTSWTARRI
jgi:acyl-CoA synthetase (AMP-forming)/AMP-acid ligase II